MYVGNEIPFNEGKTNLNTAITFQYNELNCIFLLIKLRKKDLLPLRFELSDNSFQNYLVL